MAQVLLLGVLPMCVYMLYLIYLGLFLIGLVLLAFHLTDPKAKAKRRLKKVLEEKQLRRQKELEDLRTHLEGRITKPESDTICSLPFGQLAAEIEKGQITAVKSLQAFMLKALLQSDKLNCVTDFNPGALEIAEELDRKFQSTGRTVGPLHGIPVCVKEDHDIRGMDTTLGNSQLLFQPKKSSAVLVEALVQLGAIPFCKTNVPQTLMSNGSHNPIFGATKNCVNQELSPGGSSSGSASLIGAGGALFGTGSDFGGSLRAPAHFCGISSIKPTIGRLSDKGLQSCVPSMGLRSVPGILGKNSETVAVTFKHLVDHQLQHKLDPTCIPSSWDQATFDSKKSLTIGYFTSLPFFPTIGDTSSAVLSAQLQLENAGYKLVRFDMPDSFEINSLFSQLAFADQGHYLQDILDKEPEVSRDVLETWPLLFAPTWKRKLLQCLIAQPWFPSHSKRLLMMQDNAGNSTDLWNVWQRRNELRAEVLNSMKKSNIDALISPVFAFPAITFENTRKLVLASYTQTWSLLDFPVGVTRFGTESCTNIDSYDDEGDSLLKLAKKAVKHSKDMPIGLQIIGKPFEEEIVLRVMCLLDTLNTSHP